MTDPTKGHVVNVNSATLIMGSTGSGKTSLLGTLAEYVWETYHKITRIGSTDGGGIPTKVQALMQKGIVHFWRMRTRDLPDGSLSFETCIRATQGWWPARLNHATGESEPGVKLVPPITERYEMYCVNNHLVKAVPFQSLLTAQLCPQCRQMTDKTNARIIKSGHPTKGFEQIGAVCFDGLTSMLSWMMQDMGQRAGRLELKGEEGAIGGKITSGDMKFGGSTRSHVGFGQARAEELITGSLAIPNLVVPPVFTALTLDIDDEGGLAVRGPNLVGRAKTAVAGAWVGNCLESMVLKDDKDRSFFRLQLQEFIDEAGVRHLVKTRAAPGTLPPYLDDPPLERGHEGQTAFSSFNLGVFFSLLNDALRTTTAAMDEKYPDAPGLSAGVVEVGEGAISAGTAPVGSGALPPTIPAVSGQAPIAGAGTSPAGKPLPAPAGGPAQPTHAQQTQAPRAPAPKGKASPAVRPPATRPAGPSPAPQAVAPVPPVEPVLEVPVQAPVAQTAAQPSPKGAWAPPGAPRPPATAPRVGARK